MHLVVAALFSMAISEGYSLPQELVNKRESGYLRRTATELLSYRGSAGPKTMYLRLYKQKPDGGWFAVHRTDDLSFHVTAVAPRYPDTLYLVGTNDTGITVVERWVIRVVSDIQGGYRLEVAKTLLLSSPGLTHVRTCAADQAQTASFLVCQSHETGEVFRLSLPSGTRTTLLADPQYPASYVNQVIWLRHAVSGDVFIAHRLANTYDGITLQYIMLWDANLDGSPDQIEPLDAPTWLQRGYEEPGSWTPWKDWHATW